MIIENDTYVNPQKKFDLTFIRTLQIRLIMLLVAYKVKELLTLKEPRKKMHLKMSSAEVVCCKQLPSITDELSTEANSLGPEQTAPIGAV